LNAVFGNNIFWIKLRLDNGMKLLEKGLIGISIDGNVGGTSTIFEFGRSNALPDTETNEGGSGVTKN
jgi:hypothetical protein